MECKSILIVEDDLAVSQTMRDVLEILGYKVFTASNGAEGFKILKTIKPLPSLILLDLMMPKVNGWQFLDAQRSSAKYKDIPVVICSAYLESAKSVRANGFLEKPLQYSALTESVRTFCE